MGVELPAQGSKALVVVRRQAEDQRLGLCLQITVGKGA
jgi:hypothetical protein